QAGSTIEVDGTALRAFPDPHALLRIESFPSVAPAKIERLHQVARAALEGTLDRARLRSLPEMDALAQLRTLPGIGEFFAQGILMRGAGLVDAVTDDDLTPRAIQLLYALGEPQSGRGSPAGRGLAAVPHVGAGPPERLAPQSAAGRQGSPGAAAPAKVR